jgi:hypothetical protein
MFMHTGHNYTGYTRQDFDSEYDCCTSCVLTLNRVLPLNYCERLAHTAKFFNRDQSIGLVQGPGYTTKNV